MSRLIAESGLKNELVTGLKAEEAVSEVKLEDINSKKVILIRELYRITAENQELRVRAPKLNGIVKEKTEMPASYDGKVRALKTALDEQTR